MFFLTILWFLAFYAKSECIFNHNQIARMPLGCLSSFCTPICSQNYSSGMLWVRKNLLIIWENGILFNNFPISSFGANIPGGPQTPRAPNPQEKNSSPGWGQPGIASANGCWLSKFYRKNIAKYPPQSLTWSLKMMPSKRNLLFPLADVQVPC